MDAQPHSEPKTSGTRGLNQPHGAYELVLSPAILALLGWWLDSRLGTGPWLVVAFGVLGLVGAVIKLVTTYRADMARHDVSRPRASAA